MRERDASMIHRFITRHLLPWLEKRGYVNPKFMHPYSAVILRDIDVIACGNVDMSPGAKMLAIRYLCDVAFRGAPRLEA